MNKQFMTDEKRQISIRWESEPPAGEFRSQTFFQTPDYATLITYDNRRPLWLVAGTSHEGVVARWLLYETPTNYLVPQPGRLARVLDVHLSCDHSPSFVTGLSPERKAEICLSLLNAIRRYIGQNWPISATLRLDPVITELDLEMWAAAATQCGFAVEESWSYVAILPNNEEEMFQRIKPDRRTKVRKAEKLGLVFEEGRALSDFKEYYEIKRQTSNRNGLPLVPWSHFQACFDALGAQGSNKVFHMRLGDRIGASQLALVGGETLSLNGVSIADWSIEESVPANDLLQWRLLEWAIARGLKFVDFVGADPSSGDGKMRAIDHFKSRWGTQLRKSLMLRGPSSRARWFVSRVTARLGI